MSKLSKKVTMELTREERDLIVARRDEQAKKQLRPRSVEEFMIDDKCDFFDKMYEMAASTLKQIEAEGYTPNDIEQYMYEEVMQLLTPSGQSNKVFWDYFNQINRR